MFLATGANDSKARGPRYMLRAIGARDTTPPEANRFVSLTILRVKNGVFLTCSLARGNNSSRGLSFTDLKMFE